MSSIHPSRHFVSEAFTIVELLVVIVVVATLAAISVVAYKGVQVRTRDAIRTSTVRQLQKSLELYRQTHDRYPPHIGIGTNALPGFIGIWGTGYSYSVATDDSWMKNLVSDGMTTQVPKDPVNDSTHYIAYWSSSTTGYGKCTTPFYVLTVVGYESGPSIPDDSRTLTCTWGGSTANWTTSSNVAVFSNIMTPPDPI